MEMLVSTCQVTEIEEVILLKVGDKRYSIRVSEKGWSKDLKIKLLNWENRQVEVEESVSESRSTVGLDSENFSENSNGIEGEGESSVISIINSLDRASEDVANMGLAIDKVLTSKEKYKRDRSRRKEKENGVLSCEEKI
ncbi:hypothetical protein J1N35_045655, partial [Gossypium stocksii]